MCTVSFIARKHGYALAMNRDEQLSRVPGRPPKKFSTAGRGVVCPSEPGGGTWIALNDSGGAFALINWYSIPARVAGQSVTRGRVVKAVCAAGSEISASAILNTLPLRRLNPFRLVGIFPATRRIVEWRWDLKKLVRRFHPWAARQWISSGCDEPAAQRLRGRIFRAAQRRKTAGSLAWLRRLHRSHSPRAGPFSICMHRPDAATVSYTELSVSSSHALMRYHAGAPCSAASLHPLRFWRALLRRLR